MLLPPKRLSCRSIAIIGAGPAGLAAAKYLLAEQIFDLVQVYEQRSHVGGLWRHTKQAHGDGVFDVPQTSPRRLLEQPLRTSTTEDKGDNLFMSPIYDELETNIPKTLMAFSDAPFHSNLQLFPRHEDVQAYLEAYGAHLTDHIKFNMQIRSIDRNSQPCASRNARWMVQSLNVVTKQESVQHYDAVIVATGHYSIPYVPNIPGLDNWNRTFPGCISHSKYFRSPVALAGRKVIVIGSSASGLDIASQTARHCRTPLLLSRKSVSYLAAGFASNSDIEAVHEIARVDAEERSVHFIDGRIEKDIDALIFCTGYLYAYPFLEGFSSTPDQDPVTEDGTHVRHAYKHLLYIPDPTLSFLTLPQKVIPFPLAEAQAAVLARLYSGRLALPDRRSMEEWERTVLSEQGEAEFHTLTFPKDANYINELRDWAAQAEAREGLENEGLGKLPKRWGKWEYWARENFPKIRKAFIDKESSRKRFTSLEELGFCFGDGQVDDTQNSAG